MMDYTMRCGALVALFLSTSCGGTQADQTQATPCSQYRVGDYIVYEHTINHPEQGSWTATLVEVVEEQDCAQLVIHDWMEIRGERREWRMHLTDTPENQQAGRPDAVFIRQGDQWVEAQGREALVGLFSLGIDVDGPTEEVSVEEGSCEVAGEQLPCTIRTTEGTVSGHPARIVCTRSDALLWTNIGCQYLARDEDQTYMRMGPREHGRLEADQIPNAFELLQAPQ